MHIIWNETFATGIQTIDLQHRALFAIINDLQDWQAQPTGTDALQAIFTRLHNYILFHFQTEETLMAQSQLAPIYCQGHLAAHQAFRARIAHDASQLDQIEPAQLAELLDYLAAWLQHHILETDKALCQLLAASPEIEQEDERR